MVSNMIEKHAIVREGVVENVILWDSENSVWDAPEGVDVILVPWEEFVGVGYLFDGKNFTSPQEPESEEP